MACRTVRPKQELRRVVRTPDGAIEIDETGRRAGRGAYVCRDDDCLRRAIKTGAIGRALAARLPPGVLEALGAPITHQSTTMTTPTIEGGARGQE